MASKPKPMTATLSICVSADERDSIRRAAALHDLTVSAWGTSRLLASVANVKTRNAVRDYDLAPLPSGTRTARISMVMQPEDHARASREAGAAGMTLHAFGQSGLVREALRELEGASPARLAAAQNRMISRERTAAPAALKGVVSVRVPAEAATKDLDMVATLVSAALTQVGDQAYAGQAPVIHDGMSRTLARLEAAGGEWATVALSVSSIAIDIAAGMLKLPPATVATVLAWKASRAL